MALFFSGESDPWCIAKSIWVASIHFPVLTKLCLSFSRTKEVWLLPMMQCIKRHCFALVCVWVHSSDAKHNWSPLYSGARETLCCVEHKNTHTRQQEEKVWRTEISGRLSLASGRRCGGKEEPVSKSLFSLTASHLHIWIIHCAYKHIKWDGAPAPFKDAGQINEWQLIMKTSNVIGWSLRPGPAPHFSLEMICIKLRLTTHHTPALRNALRRGRTITMQRLSED